MLVLPANRDPSYDEHSVGAARVIGEIIPRTAAARPQICDRFKVGRGRQKRSALRHRVAVRTLASVALGCLWLYPVTDASAGEQPPAAQAAREPRAGELAGDPFAVLSPPGAVERGASKSAALFCSVCHGPSGNSETPEWPSLAGQHAGYIAAQLALFRARARSSPEMIPLAQTLTDADIADLAVYFAAQTPRSARLDPAFASAGGEDLYLKGDAAQGLAPCASCHGAAGAGDSAVGSPGLRGQPAMYIDAQLNNYAKGLRYPAERNGALPSRNASIMASIAKQLTSADIRALASYIQRIN